MNVQAEGWIVILQDSLINWAWNLTIVGLGSQLINNLMNGSLSDEPAKKPFHFNNIADSHFVLVRSNILRFIAKYA